MALNTLETKQHAHHLVDQLGPGPLDTVVDLLEIVVDSDDDTLSEKDRRAVAASREYFPPEPKRRHPIRAGCRRTRRHEWKKSATTKAAKSHRPARRPAHSHSPPFLRRKRQGNVKRLDGEFQGLLRLRSGNYRVRFDEAAGATAVHRAGIAAKLTLKYSVLFVGVRMRKFFGHSRQK